MAELRILFDMPADGGLHVRLVPAGADPRTQVAQPFAFDLTDDERGDLRWYLEEFLDLPDYGSRVRAEGVERRLERWGRALHDALFGEAHFAKMLAEVETAPPPRLLTVASDDARVLRLPWELMADARGPLARRLTLRRQLPAAQQAAPFEATLPLRILLIVSRPEDLGFIDPRHTTRALLDALDPLGREHLDVDFCRPPTLARLEEMLAEAEHDRRPYAIVHFDGHGTYDPRLGSLLCFEHSRSTVGESRSDPVRADELGDLLSRHHVPLVVLEACRSGQVGDTALLSVAPRLLAAGVGSVVAMSHAIHVEATRVLVDRLYGDLVRGATPGEALAGGRAALVEQPQRWLEPGPGERAVALADWFLPQLYQRGDDARLVPPAGTLPATRTATGRRRGDQCPLAPPGAPGAFPAAPRHRFQGRAIELHLLELIFRDRRAVFLHAMGGMGKTALAREAAHWWTRTGLFPDGACFLSFETGATPERVAQVLGTYLEGPAFESRPREQQLERAQELFHERPVLMVWDNFESVLPQFDAHRDSPLSTSALLPELLELFEAWTGDTRGRGCLLLTCRPAGVSLPADHVRLHGLQRPDSLYLLHRVVRAAGADAASFERDDLNTLLDTLADHPLSIELVAPHLKTMAPLEIVERFAELLPQFAGEAEEERNSSLLASLRFSTDRLSPGARVALPWLGMFRVGVFEQVLLDVTKIAPDAWQDIRGELVATALVRVDDEGPRDKRPYLRFHPTLPSAAAVVAGEADGANVRAVRARYIAVYDALDPVLRNALHGSQAHGAMEVLAREEANFRAAVGWAVADGEFGVATSMGGTLNLYLAMSNRSRERAGWALWLAQSAEAAAWSEATAPAERDAAWALFTQGHGDKALRRLAMLIERLHRTTEPDPAFELAATTLQLGRTLHHLGESRRAIPVLRATLDAWEELCEQAGVGALARGEMSPASAPSTGSQIPAPPDSADVACLGNLAATLGDLVNALLSIGEHAEALAVNDRALRLDRHLGRDRDLAAGLAQTAQILAWQGHDDEARRRSDEAIETARRCGASDLEAVALQHRGRLARDQHQYGRATEAYMRALKLFQEAGNDSGILRTCNLLGVVEQEQGRLAEARAWYERSDAIAAQRRDKQALGSTAQNLGIVCQFEGEQATRQGDADAAGRHFAQAELFLLKSLRLGTERGDEPGQAASHDQLGQLSRLMGDLDRAETHAQRAREIHERLGDVRGLSITYQTLKLIAQAHGDEAQAAHWQAKEAEAEAELARRASAQSSP